MENIIIQKKGANSFGFERIDREGVKHREFRFRGNGTLKLTDKGLCFKRWLSKKEIFIPIEKIQRVEIGMSHNYKWILFPKILKIFYEDDGETRVFGVVVGGRLSIIKGWKDYSLEWKKEIEELLYNK